MIKSGGSFVKSASVPRITELKLLEIEMVAELVTQRAQKRAERSNLPAHCRPHLHPDQHGFGTVVAKELGRPILADSQRSRRQHSHATVRYSVEI